MRLLDRYLLREFLAPFAYCLAGFLFLMVAIDLSSELKNMQELKMHGGDVAAYYLVKLPDFFIQALPVALLIALLYALTNHARHNEIIAIRGAGVSLWRLAMPYFGVGLAATVLLFAVNELWVPDSDDHAEQIKARRVGQKKVVNRDLLSMPGISNPRGGYILVAGDCNRTTGELRDPCMILTLADGSKRLLKAERASRINGTWTFFKVQEYREEAGSNSMPIPFLFTNALALPEFTQTPEEIEVDVKMSNRLGLRNARKLDIPLSELLVYLRQHPDLLPADRWLLYTKLHGRLAAPWTCLVVVLIALPFGAASGRRNIFVGVAGSIFISFSYIVLLQLCLALGTGGWLAPWLAAWLPNMVFAAAGLALAARVR